MQLDQKHKVYVVRFSHPDGEWFYKAGYTGSSIEKRFEGPNSPLAHYRRDNFLKVLTVKNERHAKWFEGILIRATDPYSYDPPNFRFSGDSECFQCTEEQVEALWREGSKEYFNDMDMGSIC